MKRLNLGFFAFYTVLLIITDYVSASLNSEFEQPIQAVVYNATTPYNYDPLLQPRVSFRDFGVRLIFGQLEGDSAITFLDENAGSFSKTLLPDCGFESDGFRALEIVPLPKWSSKSSYRGPLTILLTTSLNVKNEKDTDFIHRLLMQTGVVSINCNQSIKLTTGNFELVRNELCPKIAIKLEVDDKPLDGEIEEYFACITTEMIEGFLSSG